MLVSVTLLGLDVWSRGGFRLRGEIAVGNDRVEGNLAYQQPFRCEMELEFHILSHPVMKFDGDVPGHFEDAVLYVFVGDGLAFVETSAADTEHDLGQSEDLHVFSELIVAVDMYG